jgi:hypothetical protein
MKILEAHSFCTCSRETVATGSPKGRYYLSRFTLRICFHRTYGVAKSGLLTTITTCHHLSLVTTVITATALLDCHRCHHFRHCQQHLKTSKSKQYQHAPCQTDWLINTEFSATHILRVFSEISWFSFNLRTGRRVLESFDAVMSHFFAKISVAFWCFSLFLLQIFSGKFELLNLRLTTHWLFSANLFNDSCLI